MHKFEINTDFLLDDKPIQILSGAIHYFRVPKDDWYHSLYNLKALGFNTVETYIPWNYHEPREGHFEFGGEKDIQHFIQLAVELGLYVIIRPSPFICAEWEFGGLPSWLLNYKDMRIRSSDQRFIDKVDRYYAQLFKILKPLQIDHNGPIIMMQIENEYGSFGEDKSYLNMIKDLMIKHGTTVPLFTSDGGWAQTLRAGSMAEDNILPTANFGSKTDINFQNLKSFHDEFQKKWPLMCMEFWDGWFNRWGDDIIKRESDDLVAEVRTAVQQGHINLYMFHGGTNYGFWNGCSARGMVDLPQITSYDYDAPLNEMGNPTQKYYDLQKMLKEEIPHIEQGEPLIKNFIELKHIQLQNKVSLFNVLDEISYKTTAKYPETMEEAGDGLGYMLYRTKVHKDSSIEKFRIVDARDRVKMYIDGEHVYTGYQQKIGDTFEAELQSEDPQIDILVENMGRVNYGYKLLASTQRKGLGQGLMQDLHFVQDYEQFHIQLEQLNKEHFEEEWIKDTPAFYRYVFTLNEVNNTHIDVSAFSKGVVLVNGVNIGRYWNIGPTASLYISKALLHEGENEIIIFDTEGTYNQEINLVKEPKFIQKKGEI
ncbi:MULTISPECIES: glycoside hydrolase family 35 protein [Mammaliicoccus]|uniref:Beta-galactosidase n=1 Tax=Mammaliicoccus sciuri TaxID=1296 RepID=A0AAW5LQ00_MAMSC|nr:MULTISPECIES: beta-galactosidase family protein [Mammaliicoccus]MBG9210996.1 beta-galactosidase [Mammaliicoccus sciuri]MCD5139772.1 beta-galactosidase [Mammaliicoccus sciuri]MCJ0934755.1 beta-galactosidase [Mammaliicoccus sciuri]MCP1287904.1 beta-galactosidase [Mammaliicoccus sciuri]MCQ9303803.1 beta-galactosidase [Mammaliicoccus sciuri]